MIDEIFLTEIWSVSREEVEKVRDDPSLSDSEKMHQAAEAIASRIIKNGSYFRMTDLHDLTLLPKTEEPSHFAMGLAIGNVAAWQGIKFFDRPPQQ